MIAIHTIELLTPHHPVGGGYGNNHSNVSIAICYKLEQMNQVYSRYSDSLHLVSLYAHCESNGYC